MYRAVKTLIIWRFSNHCVIIIHAFSPAAFLLDSPITWSFTITTIPISYVPKVSNSNSYKRWYRCPDKGCLDVQTFSRRENIRHSRTDVLLLLRYRCCPVWIMLPILCSCAVGRYDRAARARIAALLQKDYWPQLTSLRPGLFTRPLTSTLRTIP